MSTSWWTRDFQKRQFWTAGRSVTKKKKKRFHHRRPGMVQVSPWPPDINTAVTYTTCDHRCFYTFYKTYRLKTQKKIKLFLVHLWRTLMWKYSFFSAGQQALEPNFHWVLVSVGRVPNVLFLTCDKWLPGRTSSWHHRPEPIWQVKCTRGLYIFSSWVPAGTSPPHSAETDEQKHLIAAPSFPTTVCPRQLSLTVKQVHVFQCVTAAHPRWPLLRIGQTGPFH